MNRYFKGYKSLIAKTIDNGEPDYMTIQASET